MHLLLHADPDRVQVLAMQARIEELERRLSAAAVAPGNPYQADAPGTPSTTPTQLTASAQVSEQIPTPGSTQSVAIVTGNRGTTYVSTSSIQPPTAVSPQPLNAIERQPHLLFPWTLTQLEFWEDVAAQAGAVHLSLPMATVAHLLRDNAIWIQPAFLFTVRPCFLRDSACGGRFSSPLLMATVCLHATRFTHHHLQDDLLARVRLLLGQTLHEEPTIPTVQSLLYFSAFEIGRGSFSQGWLYSGMAYRMAVDLGIFGRNRSSESDPVLNSVCEQLAWSCFAWDKAVRTTTSECSFPESILLRLLCQVSLYLGRTPSLPRPPCSDPRVLDELGEISVWVPHSEQKHDGNGATHGTPPMLSHAGSCFVNHCKLAVIINDILSNIYVGKSVVKSTEPLPFVQQTRQRLEQWKHECPSHLNVDLDDQKCPPPHILTLNALYYAAMILLHRPFRQSPGCLSICRTAAEAVEHLVVLLENSRGLGCVTYLMAYCAYTAATVAILDMHDRVEGSHRAVNTYLRALYGIQKGCPGIQRSIDILVKAFDTTAPVPEATVQSELLPAFPLDSTFDVPQFQNVDNFEGMPFGDLDPFAMEWSRLPMNAFDEYMPMYSEEQDGFQLGQMSYSTGSS